MGAGQPSPWRNDNKSQDVMGWDATPASPCALCLLLFHTVPAQHIPHSHHALFSPFRAALSCPGHQASSTPLPLPSLSPISLDHLLPCFVAPFKAACIHSSRSLLALARLLPRPSPVLCPWPCTACCHTAAPAPFSLPAALPLQWRTDKAACPAASTTTTAPFLHHTRTVYHTALKQKAPTAGQVQLMLETVTSFLAAALPTQPASSLLQLLLLQLLPTSSSPSSSSFHSTSTAQHSTAPRTHACTSTSSRGPASLARSCPLQQAQQADSTHCISSLPILSLCKGTTDQSLFAATPSAGGGPQCCFTLSALQKPPECLDSAFAGTTRSLDSHSVLLRRHSHSLTSPGRDSVIRTIGQPPLPSTCSCTLLLHLPLQRHSTPEQFCAHWHRLPSFFFSFLLHVSSEESSPESKGSTLQGQLLSSPPSLPHTRLLSVAATFTRACTHAPSESVIPHTHHSPCPRGSRPHKALLSLCLRSSQVCHRVFHSVASLPHQQPFPCCSLCLLSPGLCIHHSLRFAGPPAGTAHPTAALTPIPA